MQQRQRTLYIIENCVDINQCFSIRNTLVWVYRILKCTAYIFMIFTMFTFTDNWHSTTYQE